MIAYRLPVEVFRALPRLPADTVGKIAEARRSLRKRVDSELQHCDRLGIRILTRQDPDYPAALEPLPDRPLILYVKGTLPPGVVRVAVVGSRRATPYGKRVAIGLAGGLAARGIDVVSGGARGIDSCAHRGALEEEGRSVAVLGSGLLRPYPAENAELFDQLARSGAVLTEFPLEYPPMAENFPRRNRLISGLSVAVIVVEAALKSGSLVTAGHALDQGREVLAVPGPVSSSRSAGCHKLIQQGAQLVQNIDDILEELSPFYRSEVGSPPDPLAKIAQSVEDLGPDERSVLELLDAAEPRHLDELVDAALFGIPRLQSALLGLELRGRVEQTGGGYYLLRPSAEAEREN